METYEERMKFFGSSYEDFEPSEIFDLVGRTGEWLELIIMDDQVVAKMMRLLYQEIRADFSEGDADRPWRELFVENTVNAALEMRGAQFVVGLNAFAFYGLAPSVEILGSSADQSLSERVAAYVMHGRRLLDAIPKGWGKHDGLAQTVLAAEARWLLDTGRDVSPEQLAALARLNLKSLRNQMSVQADLKPNKVGELPNAVARRWVNSRPTYLASIWQREDSGHLPITTSDAQPLDEVVFVPVAKDGSWFDPVSCRTSNGYMIGAKGNEQVVEKYREALSRLSRMPTPYWRRPSIAGNRGIVSGVNWVRKEANELGLDAGEPK